MNHSPVDPPVDPSDRHLDREEISAMVREALRQQIGGQYSVGARGEDSAPPIIDESTKDVITEADLRDIHADVRAGALLLIREDAIITPAARDLIRERGLEIRHRARRSVAGKRRIIAVGADHGGYEMKERLKEFLDDLGYSHRDFGTFSEEAVDYPDFAHAVARAVADGACYLGVVVDGAGIGSCMTANKVPGVRAAMCYDAATASNSREHNYANVLTLGARMISTEKMREIVSVWLSTPEGATRHGKRVAKLIAVEKQYLR
ncbi:MAG TPA: RpiB/LacA/LacB family sugar-phosphate isomerase [Blastocatellia bacterium]|nr:RpiB/LacA/LacB family sugar-phosphate isomerase [Blastocatellia bacterium]